jgi:hypothetical protein
MSALTGSQKGHWKSLNSWMITLAVGDPFVGAFSGIGTMYPLLGFAPRTIWDDDVSSALFVSAVSVASPPDFEQLRVRPLMATSATRTVYETLRICPTFGDRLAAMASSRKGFVHEANPTQQCNARSRHRKRR